MVFGMKGLEKVAPVGKLNQIGLRALLALKAQNPMALLMVKSVNMKEWNGGSLLQANHKN